MPRDDSMIIQGSGKKIVDTKPAAQVLKYQHLGLAVTDIAASEAFFAKLGFQQLSNNILQNTTTGMELHLIQADTCPKDDDDKTVNILQDTPTVKYCGHTHAAFGVPSVAAARAFLEQQDMAITGERKRNGKVQSIFIRDLDRTTWEYERNVGDVEGEITLDTSMMGDDHRRIDHVGTRVSNPTVSWDWYAKMLGFTTEVMKYEHNETEPLKNFAPWISRTPDTCIDINLLINGNMPNNDNILTTGGVLKPGIVYAGFEVADVSKSQQALQEAGASVFTTNDDEMEQQVGLKNEKVPTLDGPSFFVADPDKNLYRIVQSPTSSNDEIESKKPRSN